MFVHKDGNMCISHMVNKSGNIYLIWTKNNQYPIYWFASKYSRSVILTQVWSCFCCRDINHHWAMIWFWMFAHENIYIFTFLLCKTLALDIFVNCQLGQDIFFKECLSKDMFCQNLYLAVIKWLATYVKCLVW